MRFLGRYTIEDLIWKHHNIEQELKYFNANKDQIVIENIERLEKQRDELWSELDLRMDQIPQATLIEALDGSISLKIL